MPESIAFSLKLPSPLSPSASAEEMDTFFASEFFTGRWFPDDVFSQLRQYRSELDRLLAQPEEANEALREHIENVRQCLEQWIESINAYLQARYYDRVCHELNRLKREGIVFCGGKADGIGSFHETSSVMDARWMNIKQAHRGLRHCLNPEFKVLSDLFKPLKVEEEYDHLVLYDSMGKCHRVRFNGDRIVVGDSENGYLVIECSVDLGELTLAAKTVNVRLGGSLRANVEAKNCMVFGKSELIGNMTVEYATVYGTVRGHVTASYLTLKHGGEVDRYECGALNAL